MSNPHQKFTVAICGGGIAGLTAALAISHFSKGNSNITIDIYETASSFTEIGAGVSMYRRPWEVMKILGLEQELRKIADIPDSDDELRPSFEMRKSDQKEGVTFSSPMLPFGIVSLHRAEFLDVIARNLDPSQTRVHFSKRLTSYSLPQDPKSLNPIMLQFKDSTSSQCDILVGADGIHSVVRHCLLTYAASEMSPEEARNLRLLEKAHPKWSGSIAYRALIPFETLKALNPSHRTLTSAVNYGGKNKHLIVFPIPRRKQINVAAFVSQPEKEGVVYGEPWVHESSMASFLAEYNGWEDEVQQVLQCIDSPSSWAIHALDAIPMYSHNRVTIIGDAAHAMTPHLGSGGGVAIEDAYILGALLSSPLATIETLSDVLKIYQSVRLPIGNEVQSRSRSQGKLYEQDFKYIQRPVGEKSNIEEADLNGAALPGVGDHFIASGRVIEENRRWVGRPGVNKGLEHALSKLQTVLQKN